MAALMVLIQTPTVPNRESGTSASTGVLLAATSVSPSTFPISHIIFLVMENHAFDNYFGKYCQKTSLHCSFTVNGIPPGTCSPKNPTNLSAGCVKPYALNQSDVWRSPGGPHTWDASHTALDDEAMDGFYLAARSKTVFGYFDGSTIPTYWNLAEQYALGDNLFSSALSFSLPNHWYILAGQAPNESENSPIPFPGQYQAAPLNPAYETYLNESNATEAIDDLLVNSTASWEYYDQSLNNATYLEALNDTVHGSRTQPAVFDFKNPLAAKAESYGASLESHFVNYGTFFSDASSGHLPNVSWLIPPESLSDHPPNNISLGMQFVNSVADAIENSSEWNSTALFVSWDDYGGFYDHVAPLQLDSTGLSFRVPLLVVSPYTPLGYVSHQWGYFESILHLMEWRFGLSTITYRDFGAPLPLDYFDVNATPRAPDHVSTNAKYPTVQPAQNVLKLSGVKATAGSTSAVVTWSERTGGAPVAGFTVRYGSGPVLTTRTVPRTTSSTNLTLACNTSYTIKVSAFAGPTQGPASIVTVKTGACTLFHSPSPSLVEKVMAQGDKTRAVRTPPPPPAVR